MQKPNPLFSYLYCPCFVYQQIRRLQVSMDNRWTQSMEIVHSPCLFMNMKNQVSQVVLCMLKHAWICRSCAHFEQLKRIVEYVIFKDLDHCTSLQTTSKAIRIRYFSSNLSRTRARRSSWNKLPLLISKTNKLYNVCTTMHVIQKTLFEIPWEVFSNDRKVGSLCNCSHEKDNIWVPHALH